MGDKDNKYILSESDKYILLQPGSLISERYQRRIMEGEQWPLEMKYKSTRSMSHYRVK